MLFSFFRQRSSNRKPLSQRVPVRLSFEPLEQRSVPSAFTVLNLNSTGPGSFSQAIHDANAHPGPDVINFGVAGTFRLSAALPVVTGKVDINGASAPGYAGTPVVEIDCEHFGGLRFESGSSGSELAALDLVDASAAGVTVNGAGNMLIVGNYIGVGLDGKTVVGNGGNGLELDNSCGNIIGESATQDRNLVSGNRGNGIMLNDSSNNQIANNAIGTDVTGMVDLGNAQNGILLTAGAAGNVIGGTATGGNEPTNGVFVRPPQGNLISGNFASGVLITGNATQNILNGNFIGTDITGNAPLGNYQDGVAIQNANGNGLIGCAITTDPFVFYNVISGNGGNGLQITNSNNTTVQGNFFGLGANNLTPVGNRLNGVVVEGSSTNTVMGGPIPLGNVDSANGRNGILVQDTASFFTTYNTFAGLAAFETYTNLGNGNDGMLITSTGSNILIRTCVVTENGNDGIEISGAASGVRVAGNIIGLDTKGNLAMGNKNNGVEVDGQAHNDVIGGPQATFNIIPHNAIAANGVNGVAIDGNAHNILVNFSDIGTDLLGEKALGNARAGVYLGVGTYANTIGSASPNLPTVISGNLGNGVELSGAHGNLVIGSLIGLDALGLAPLGNVGNGVYISNSSNNIIGRTPSTSFPASAAPADEIAFNGADGVFVASGNGNAIGQNSIFGNALLGIDLGPSANRNQAAPVLTSVQIAPLGIQVSGTLSSRPNTTFTIEFYANDTNSPSGRYYLGSETVKTNLAGIARFTFNSPLPPTSAGFVTATATDPNNDTSEFSAPLAQRANGGLWI